MSSKGPTASAIRAANRNAVGGGRKRCTRGKNCSAACIAGDETCLVGLPEPVSESTGKVVNMLQQRKASTQPKQQTKADSASAAKVSASPEVAPLAPPKYNIRMPDYTKKDQEYLDKQMKTQQTLRRLTKRSVRRAKEELDAAPEGAEKKKLAKALQKHLKEYVTAREKMVALKKAGATMPDPDWDLESDKATRDRGRLIRSAQKYVKLTKEQREAIDAYTSQSYGLISYKLINQCLRNPSSCQEISLERIKDVTKSFDEALQALPKNTKGGEFYRGHNAEGKGVALFRALENAKPGDKMSDPGYGSYTYNRKVAEDWSQGRRILFISRSKELTPIDYYSAVKPEREAVLPKGTEQTIKSVKKVNDNYLIVELE